MKNKSEALVLVIALLALAAKIYCAATTLGTTDTLLFTGFGRYIAQEDVVSLYAKTRLFNHPPLLGNFLGLIYRASGGDEQRFAFYNRLPGIFADLGVVLLMLWIRRRTGQPPWWALCVLAASPVCFMISGYHGNYDSLIALGLVLTVVACMLDRQVLTGVLLGLACQVKVIPLVMAPVLFFYWFRHGKGLRFALVAAVTLAAGWSEPLFALPGTFVHQVLVYNSIWGWWGIPYLLANSGVQAFSGIALFKPLTTEQTIVVEMLKTLVIGSAIFIAWHRRKESAPNVLGTMALIWAVFFTFAPGFGAQYLAWVSPFILFYSPRWFAAFTAAASVGLFVFYNSISNGMPWNRGYRLEQHAAEWAPWMLLPWAVFAAMAIASYRDLLGLPRRVREAVKDAGAEDKALASSDATTSSAAAP